MPHCHPIPAALAAAALLAAPHALAQTQRCLQADTTADTCSKRSGGVWVCDVHVYSTPGGPVVYPYTLLVPRAAVKPTIVWHLLEPGSAFRTDDGPLELKEDTNFTGGAPSASAAGASMSLKKQRRYRIVQKVVAPGASHHYSIQYVDPAGNVRKCDPNINNQSG